MSSPPFKHPTKLEVVVTSLQDATEAHAGGADRLEVVTNLSIGGLTPSKNLVESIATAVPLPLRVMLRTNGTMSLDNITNELAQLAHAAEQFATMPSVDGFVLGFLTKDNQLDLQTTTRLANVAPHKPFTFHRAFDELPNSSTAIEQLVKSLPNIDRILTTGQTPHTNNDWAQRANTITKWQNAFPRVTFLMASGPDPNDLLQMTAEHNIREIHIGRAARLPATNESSVSRTRVAAVKRNLLVATQPPH